MKKLLLGALLLLSMSISAQGNSDEDNWENGNSENAGGGNGNGPASAPIDGYLYFVAIAGGAYVLTKVVSRKTSNR